jgi:tetratricopeptide (TPR) repeat protein
MCVGLGAAVLLSALIAVYHLRSPWDGMTSSQIAAAISQKNRGLAYLENYALRDARREFEALTRALPQVALGHANLAIIASVPRTQWADATAHAHRAVARAPRDASLRRLLGRLLLEQKEIEGAIRELRIALAFHPNDARTLFELAETYQWRPGWGDFGRKRGPLLRRLVGILPENLAVQLMWARYAAAQGEFDDARTALYRAMLLAGDMPASWRPYLDRARSAVNARNAPRAVAEIQILFNLFRLSPRLRADWLSLDSHHGDPSAEAVREFSPPAPEPALTPPAPIPARFRDVTSEWGLPLGDLVSEPNQPRALGTLAVTHLDPPRMAAIYVASPSGDGRFFLRKQNRFIESGEDAGLAGVSGSVAGFADIDNDGHLDLYVAGVEGEQVRRGVGEGRFRKMNLRAPSLSSGLVGALWLSSYELGSGEDEFLDLLRLECLSGQSGLIRLLRNKVVNRLFSQIQTPSGTGHNPSRIPTATLTPAFSAVIPEPRGALFDDLDLDGDRDLVVLSGTHGLRLFDNLLNGRFHNGTRDRGIRPVTGCRGVAAADLDGDGAPDLVLIRAQSPRLIVYRNRLGRGFTETRTEPELLGGIVPEAIALLDFDNDGQMDLVVAGKPEEAGRHCLQLLRGDGTGRFSTVQGAFPPVSSARIVMPADLDGDGAVDLTVLRNDGGVTVIRNESRGSNHWLAITLEDSLPDSTQSNRFGLGGTLEVKRGWQTLRQTVRDPITHFGLGPSDTPIDTVRCVWPDGRVHNLLDRELPKLDSYVRARYPHLGW